MTERGTAPPPQAAAVTDTGGYMALSWRRFLESLWRRLGGFQDISMTATSDTNLRFSYRGSDGVTRTGDLTLS